jgi:hypothetical protein
MGEAVRRLRTLSLYPVATRVYALGSRIMESVLGPLRNTDQPILSYIWRAWLIAAIPRLALLSLVIVGAIMFGFEMLKEPSADPLIPVLVSGLLLGPWGETLLMWPTLWILKSFLQRTALVALACGVIMGLIHELNDPGSILLIWAFFVYSLCFLEWEKKSKGKAIVVTAIVHTLENVVPAACIVIEFVAS